MCQHVRGRQRGLSRKGFIPKMLVERSSMCEAGSVDRLSVGAFVGFPCQVDNGHTDKDRYTSRSLSKALVAR